MYRLVLLNVIGALAVLMITTPPCASSSNKDGGFRSVALNLHNYYRKQNKAPRLQLDQELNKLAHAHAEKLANWNNLTASEYGFPENLWSHRGELLPLAKDCEYAIKNWYTGSMAPGRVQSSVNTYVLRSGSVRKVGFGVGTSDKTGEGYSVVVALYS